MSTAAVTPMQPAPLEFRAFTVANRDGWVAVPGELTLAQGVVITPKVQIASGSPGFTGDFTLTHVVTGMELVPVHLPPQYLHRMAAELGRSRIDWTAPGESLTGDQRGQAIQALSEARRVAELAFLDEDGE